MNPLVQDENNRLVVNVPVFVTHLMCCNHQCLSSVLDELRFCNTTTDKEDPESAALISVGIYPALLTGTSHRVRTSRYGVALAADSMFTKIVLRLAICLFCISLIRK